MPTIVKTRIIKIGNSQGIRIPRILLEQTNLGAEVELEVYPNQIVLRAAQQPRAAWENAFKEMAAREDDKLVDGNALLPTILDAEEWEW